MFYTIHPNKWTLEAIEKIERRGNKDFGKFWQQLLYSPFENFPLNSFCQHLFDEKRKRYIYLIYIFKLRRFRKKAVYIFIFIYAKYKKPLFWYRIVICQSLGSPTPSVNSWLDAWSAIGKAIRVMLYDGWCSCRRIRFPLICSFLKLNNCRNY